ncbi:uncharacterized protein B0T23DRAFT_140954 [Neurospora hispaniola]|uniref:Uncharacterized protein n=1 Tax=Neurospora hispaniola TaxID=588809 RepID=A0AAJ0I7H7_9PEZI|nr:hypothetical protein B0T23DRAFT_140954 [Neurospora hispaniola]
MSESELASWYSWITGASLLPTEWSYGLEVLTGIFKTLALVPMLPIIALVVYDFTLWMWRLLVIGRNPQREAIEYMTGGSVAASPSGSLPTTPLHIGSPTKGSLSPTGSNSAYKDVATKGTTTGLAMNGSTPIVLRKGGDGGDVKVTQEGVRSRS